MTHYFHKPRVLIATVALACFGAGYAGSEGTHVVQRQVAVNQTFVAAREVDHKRQELETSLARAQGVANQAARVGDDAGVKRAAHSLWVTSADALTVASNNAVDVEAAPVQMTEAALLRPATLLPSITEPDLIQADTDHEDLAEVVEDAAVAEVLAGEVTDVSAARDATDKLNDVSEALDSALAQVDASAAKVQDETDRVNLDRELDQLDEGAAQSPAATDAALAVLDTIGLRVTDSVVLTHVDEATSALTDATSGAATLDTTDLSQVRAAATAVSRATVALADAVEAARTSYLAWIDDENARRESLNDQRLDEYDDAVTLARDSYTEANLDFVAERSNGWTGKPAQLSGSNGRLSSDSLCAVDFAPGHRLQCDAAHALEGADSAYFDETGQHLRMTDSYRSYGLQVTTRARKPTTAGVPGTSNHGWGMAVDLDAASAAWLTANGPQFGWVNPDWARPGGAKPESWHLEYVAPELGGFVGPAQPSLLDPLESELP